MFKPTETDRKYANVYNLKPTKDPTEIDCNIPKPTALGVSSPQVVC